MAMTSRRMILAEAGRDESIDILIVQTPTLFDHRSGQSRQRGELAVLGQTALANGPDVRWIDPFLERQSRMERDGPVQALVTASVSRTVWTCASVKLPPCTLPNRPTRLLIRTGEVAIAPAMLGIMPKADCNCCSAGFDRSGADRLCELESLSCRHSLSRSMV